MVKLFPVRSTSSIADSKDTASSGLSNKAEGKNAPNRFKGSFYDRSVFGDGDCKKATMACHCTLCSENPLVVVSGSTLFEQNNVSLKNIREFVDGGMLQSIVEESFIVYSQVSASGREQIGLLAAIDVADCKNNIVKCHEQVTKNVETICFDKFSPKSCVVDPLMIMYRSQDTINVILSKVMASRCPHHSWTDPTSGEAHRLWLVESPQDMMCIRRAFAPVESVYIADGHHRTASACILSDSPIVNRKSPNYVQSSKYLTALLYPHDQLHVESFHRCVKTLNGLSAEDFLERVASIFKVEVCTADNSTPAVGNVKTMGMYLQGKWYSLQLLDSYQPDPANPLSHVDAQILMDLLFKPVLGIKDTIANEPSSSHDSTDINSVVYISGQEGLLPLQSLVDVGTAAVAFAVRSVSVEDILSVADAGMLLPPKATFFSPKPKVGLISRLQR